MESIIIKIFNNRQLLITPSLLNFLMKRLDRSYKEINNFIEIIDKTSLKKGKKISIKLINDILN
jgi:chromosomal replication initiation ATPase DnaA